MAAVKNFTLDQGSDKTVSFVLSDKNGPLDLTGYSAAMQLRRYAFSEEAVDTLTTCNGRLQIDDSAGKVTAKFNHEKTERYPGDTVLYDLELEKKQASEAAERRSQIGTGDRSEKIRTYNFPQGRVTDHRIKLTLHKLDSILNGDLDEIIDSLIAADQTAKLAKMEE